MGLPCPLGHLPANYVPSWDVLPLFAPANPFYLRLRHGLEHLSQLFVTHAFGVSPTYGGDIARCEFTWPRWAKAAASPATPMWIRPTFGCRVSVVVAFGPKEKVERVAARGIVAPVQHAEFSVKISEEDLVRHSVSGCGFESSVALLVSMSSPRPT